MHSVHSLPPCPFRCCADSVASLPKRPPKTNPETSRDSLPHREDGCRLFAKGGERGHERRGEDEDEARERDGQTLSFTKYTTFIDGMHEKRGYSGIPTTPLGKNPI